MGIIYIDGHADQFDLFRVPQAFREVFGGEVSSTTMTFSNPETPDLEDYFCMKLDIEEIHDMYSFTKLKIERVLKNLKTDTNFFEKINVLEPTAELDHIFSLQEQSMTPEKQAAMKKELGNIRETEQSPDSMLTLTTRESTPSSLDDGDDEKEDLPKFKF